MVAERTNGNTRAVQALSQRYEGWEMWTLRGLQPTPEEEWQRLREFLSLSQADQDAMLETVEVLLRRGHEFVVANYDYLLKNQDTAAILGWEDGADPEHLAERRRFFTVWLARTLGLDLSDDFARYLFRAGQMHAGHGPRAIHVPDMYVTGAISLVNATFARYLAEDMPGHPAVPAALAGWNKVLAMHLHMMLAGYHTARDLESGDFPVTIKLFGQVRAAVGRSEVEVYAPDGGRAETVLRKFFNYYPHVRDIVFEQGWEEQEPSKPEGTPWVTVDRVYTIKTHPAWRALLNGRNLCHIGGPEVVVSPGDEIRFYSPGR